MESSGVLCASASCALPTRAPWYTFSTSALRFEAIVVLARKRIVIRALVSRVCPFSIAAAIPGFSIESFPIVWTAVCVLLKRKKQKARPKEVNLKVRWRAKVAMRYCSEESAHRAILLV